VKTVGVVAASSKEMVRGMGATVEDDDTTWLARAPDAQQFTMNSAQGLSKRSPQWNLNIKLLSMQSLHEDVKLNPCWQLAHT
jgi:hypothetical protein